MSWGASLSRAGKGMVRRYLARVAGYSDAQLTRLIAQQRRTGPIRDHRLRPPARPFATLYTAADTRLPAVDRRPGRRSGALAGICILITFKLGRATELHSLRNREVLAVGRDSLDVEHVLVLRIREVSEGV